MYTPPHHTQIREAQAFVGAGGCGLTRPEMELNMENIDTSKHIIASYVDITIR